MNKIEKCTLKFKQPFVLQFLDSYLDPLQFLPPLAGAGLLHFLVLLFIPDPQVLEQLDH